MKHLELTLGLIGWVVFLLSLTTSASAQTMLQRPTDNRTELTMPVSTPGPTSEVTAAAYENFQNGNLTRAVQQWTQAIRAEDDVVRSLFNRSQAFVMLGQYEFALRDINQIIDIEGSATGADVFLVLGIVLGNLGQLPEALASFEQFESQQPSALIYSNRALIHQRAGNLQLALSDLKERLRYLLHLSTIST